METTANPFMHSALAPTARENLLQVQCKFLYFLRLSNLNISLKGAIFYFFVKGVNTGKIKFEQNMTCLKFYNIKNLLLVFIYLKIFFYSLKDNYCLC